MRKSSAALAAALFITLLAAPAVAKRYNWQRDPGPIAGSWRPSCSDQNGMVIKITLNGTNEATGVVQTVGEAKQFGYRAGETIFKLKANDFGAWVGKHLWRSVNRVKRWDPIYFVATQTGLDARMTTDSCYKNMTRAQ